MRWGEWISTAERMPDPGVEVLIVRSEPEYDAGPTPYVGQYDPSGGYYVWRTSEIDLEADAVVAWMPIPGPLPVR